MLRLPLLFLLAVALFWGCISIGFFGEDSIETCGGEKYTSGKQICEEGILKNPCGNGYHDPKMQFCFDNAVFEKCGGKVYDPLSIEKICENDILKIKCVNDYYDPEMQFCRNDEIYDKCISFTYDPLEVSCCNNKIYILTTQKCDNGIILTKCGDEAYEPSLKYCIDDVIKDKEKFIDNRDGKAYMYITIGTQVWMAENLRYESPNSKCYDNDLNNCKIFGRFYDWNTAKTICPSGWHLPSNMEWNKLRDFAGNFAGRKLKSNGELWQTWEGWYYGKGTDDFGFTALPSGSTHDGVHFTGIGDEARFWTTNTGSYAGSAICRVLTIYESILASEEINASWWTSVRCIKD